MDCETPQKGGHDEMLEFTYTNLCGGVLKHWHLSMCSILAIRVFPKVEKQRWGKKPFTSTYIGMCDAHAIWAYIYFEGNLHVKM